MAITLNGTTGITSPAETVQGNLSYTGTLTGGTGVVNIGSGQVYKDASGNVLLGTTSTINSAQLTGNKATNYRFNLASDGTERFGIFVDSGISALYSASTMSFTTNGTERARIDTSGNLLVGSASGANRLKVFDAVDRAQAAAQVNIEGAGYNLFFHLDGTAAYIGQNSGGRALRMYSGNNTAIGVNLVAGSNSWGTYSDERLKDIIEPIKNGIEKLSALRTVIGKYKIDETNKRRVFLIAQDVHKVLPEAVSEEASGELSLQYQDLIPVLIAANQEQQALIVDLTTRLTALENK